MARQPEWFSRLDTIEETLQHLLAAEWFGRQEVAAAFGVSDRDSIRLLHKGEPGTGRLSDALPAPRFSPS